MHRHIWKITQRDEQPSPKEILGGAAFKYQSSEDPLNFLRRPVVVTYRCERCGSERVERV
jgi:hypothetical protein